MHASIHRTSLVEISWGFHTEVPDGASDDYPHIQNPFSVYWSCKKKSGMREKQAIYRKSTASTTYESREEALSDAICCDNSINKGSRAGPCVALAHV